MSEFISINPGTGGADSTRPIRGKAAAALDAAMKMIMGPLGLPVSHSEEASREIRLGMIKGLLENKSESEKVLLALLKTLAEAIFTLKDEDCRKCAEHENSCHELYEMETIEDTVGLMFGRLIAKTGYDLPAMSLGPNSKMMSMGGELPEGAETLDLLKDLAKQINEKIRKLEEGENY